MKPVHVELSHKRTVVGVLEVAWKDILGELINVLYEEAFPVLCPSDPLRQLGVLG